MTLVKKRHDVDMTTGSIVKNIIIFALPLLLGNLFQQLYNMVDTWVIGQTGESGAYAAVGSVGPVINILIGFFMGFSSGAGVVISQYYGAKNSEGVKRTVHTAVTVTLILCVFFTVAGVLMTPLLLKLMLASESGVGEIYPYAKTYLAIYFAGVSSLMVYNVGSGILRAVGDSTRPFIFLVVSALTNIVLDVLFVFGFDMGVTGVALATVISQTVSAVLTVATLMTTQGDYRLSPKALCVDGEKLIKILKVGVPSGLQMSLTSFSNVFVQSYIGGVAGDQTASLGGWTTYSKVDMIIFLPAHSISLAVTTFVAQNLGIGDVKRARKGTYISFFMSLAAAAALMIPVLIFAPQVARLFNADPAVVECATKLLHAITPFYLLTCVNQNFSGALRGAGNSTAPMLIMLSSFVAFRQIYLFVVSNYISNELIPVAMGYPAGWLLCATLTLIYFLRYDMSRSLLSEKKNK